MDSSLKKHTVISCVIFVLVFAALLVTATFTDLQVSQILTKGTLAPGSFLADGVFGVVFECIGCSAPYLVGAFALQVMFIYALRFSESKTRKTILCLILGIAVFAVYYALAIDILGFNLRHYGVDGTPAFVKAELFICAIPISGAALFATNNLTDESVKKLLRFTYAVLVAIAVSSLTVEFLKRPFGRPRFRAMNYAHDFSYYSRWYVLNGQPDKEWMREYFSSTDACKSFPSGHTQAASLSFCIVMLKDALGINSKKIKALLWCAPVVCTGTVALSRIMVGAHFFSDVLVGGTIGFLTVMLTREIFVCRGSHIKALKSGQKQEEKQ